VTLEELPSAIAELRAQLPQAQILSSFHQDIPPAERARIDALLTPPAPAPEEAAAPQAQ
jgi:hypothetical protein